MKWLNQGTLLLDSMEVRLKNVKSGYEVCHGSYMYYTPSFFTFLFFHFLFLEHARLQGDLEKVEQVSRILFCLGKSLLT